MAQSKTGATPGTARDAVLHEELPQISRFFRTSFGNLNSRFSYSHGNMQSQQSAIIIQTIGQPVQLGLRDIPEPKEGEILVKVSFSMNFGLFARDKLPFVPAANIAGRAQKLGLGVTGFGEGDRVFGYSISSDKNLQPDHGGLQQYAILRADALGKTPEGFLDEQVATLPTNLVTSWQTLFTSSGFDLASPLHTATTGNGCSSKAVVILAAGSNIGKFAVQLAHIAGVGKIIAVAGASNKQKLLDMGATHFFDRHRPEAQLTLAIHSVTGPEGVEYVYDCYNSQLSLSVALLSRGMRSVLRTTQPISSEQMEKLRIARPFCDAGQIHGANENLHPNAREFWKRVAEWLRAGMISPTKFQLIEGLEKVDEINAALDAYRDAKGGDHWIVKILGPNEAERRVD